MANSFIGPNIEIGGTSSRDLTALGGLLLISNNRDSRSLLVSGAGSIVLPLGDVSNPEEPIIGDSFEIITQPASTVALRAASLPAPLVSLVADTVNRYAYVNGAWTLISSYAR
jgi:hypothetical protein